MSVTNQQVVTLLENVLFEPPTQAVANAGTWIDNSAAGSVPTLAVAMANSGEAKIATTVVGYYLTSLGRAPTAAEVQYYVGVAEQGLTQSQIAAGQVSGGTWDQIASYFSHSAEFTARAGLDYSLGVTGGLLEAVPFLYEQVLGRTPTSAEISYYDNQVINGTDLGVLFREFTASPEFHTDTDAQIAAALASFGNAAVAGTNTTVAIGVTVGAPPPPTSTPSPAPTPTPTFHALTTANDTIDDSSVSGAHTYTAILGVGATLNGLDSLTGNGLATLTITDGTDARVTLPGTLSGIATIQVDATAGNFGTGSGSFAFNVAGVSGLTDLIATSSSAASTDFFTATSSVNVTLTSSTSTINIFNAGTVDITDNAITTLGLGGTIGAVTIHDPTHAAAYTFTLETGSAALAGFTDANGMVATLDITSTGVTTIGAITDSGLTNLTVTGGAGDPVTLGTSGAHISLGSSVTTINLSGDPTGGGINYIDNAGNNATVTLGNSDNHFTNLSIVADGGTITAGNGDNTITDDSFFGTTSITVGNGNNTINDSSPGGGGGTITAGNGNNTITDISLNGAASITVGNGNNTITANSTAAAGTFSLGTGINSLDLQSAHAAASITVGADAVAVTNLSDPNLVIHNPVASGSGLNLTIAFGSQTGLTGNDIGNDGGSLGGALFSALTATAGLVEAGNDGSNTYILESDGQLTTGHVTLIEIAGVHAVVINANSISVT